jgi:hypothetical protein
MDLILSAKLTKVVADITDPVDCVTLVLCKPRDHLEHSIVLIDRRNPLPKCLPAPVAKASTCTLGDEVF